MVRAVCVSLSRSASKRLWVRTCFLYFQIPWGDEFEHKTAQDLFASNLVCLEWIKSEPMPGKLVDEILRALGMARIVNRSLAPGSSTSRRHTSPSLKTQGLSPKSSANATHSLKARSSPSGNLFKSGDLTLEDLPEDRGAQEAFENSSMYHYYAQTQPYHA